MTQWWAEPTAGDIVWCHFPDDIHPRPKPRPALVLIVFDDGAPQFEVRVVYGTSQRTTTLSILRERNPTAYVMAGLSYETKFDLKQTLDLPYTTEWFSVPPARGARSENSPRYHTGVRSQRLRSEDEGY